MAKAEKTPPAATDGAAKPNSKKKLLFIILGVLVLVAGGGAGWYFTKGGRHAEEAKAPPPAPPKFMALEPFTVNLQNDTSEQFLQIGITLKFVEPELEEQIKLHMPEIRSRLVFLLSSKRASDLVPVEGKKKLVQEIIAETSSVLGLRNAPAPKIVVFEDNAGPDAGASSAVETGSAEAASAPDETVPPPVPVAARRDKQTGIVDVLFTSFIIQ
ncbi:hypothetical protein GALLN_00289 [Gallionellaceae bacterium]|nr:hypothetical protein GALLN_00289 [Gallionellaceae bacterium]